MLLFAALTVSGFGQETLSPCGAPVYAGAYEYSEAQTQPREDIARIAVVVHIVYQTASENISDEQVFSQIEVLNRDYSANNLLDIVPAFFQNLIADMEIEFCLAARDPNGAPSSGITRTITTVNNIGSSEAVHYSNLGGKNAWDPEQYLNIWVANMGESLNGRASFPGQGDPLEDGVVIDPRYFGTQGLPAPPYHLGRTCTHEIGHYFNLLHPWGPGAPSCNTDDEVDDTPLSTNTFLHECPMLPINSCASLDMYTNFMYFTNDACMAQFTPGQKARVWATLNGPRKGLLQSSGCTPVSTRQAQATPEIRLFPQPANEFLWIEWKNQTGKWQYTLYNLQGQTIRRGQAESNTYQIDLSSLPGGLYLLEVQSPTESATQKVMVARK